MSAYVIYLSTQLHVSIGIEQGKSKDHITEGTEGMTEGTEGITEARPALCDVIFGAEISVASGAGHTRRRGHAGGKRGGLTAA